MAKQILNDELWKSIEPLLPPPKPRRGKYAGRRPITRRQALTGILFVLRSGIAWERLPREMGCGSGMTCWRHLREWQRVGAWPKIQEVLIARWPDADQIDWSRVQQDSSG